MCVGLCIHNAVRCQMLGMGDSQPGIQKGNIVCLRTMVLAVSQWGCAEYIVTNSGSDE